jgi:ubiquinone/menaquinone biosynthesis C-methylase UbiE
MRIFDVGCGFGNPPVRAAVQADDDVIGLDISAESLNVARTRYRHRQFVGGRAEQLPFLDGSFDRVVSSVSLPYIDIPSALAEARRVLTKTGTVFMALHSWRFTLQELRTALPRPTASIFRMYVLLNGLLFHLTGRTLKFANGRTESFQTKRGIRLALNRAGFTNVVFRTPDGRLIVEAMVAHPAPRGVLDSSIPSPAA